MGVSSRWQRRRRLLDSFCEAKGPAPEELPRAIPLRELLALRPELGVAREKKCRRSGGGLRPAEAVKDRVIPEAALVPSSRELNPAAALFVPGLQCWPPGDELTKAKATGSDPVEVKVVETNPVVDAMSLQIKAAMKSDVVEIVFEAPSVVIQAAGDQAPDPDPKLSGGPLKDLPEAKDDTQADETQVTEKGMDIDTVMPYGEQEPLRRDDTAQELTDEELMRQIFAQPMGAEFSPHGAAPLESSDGYLSTGTFTATGEEQQKNEQQPEPNRTGQEPPSQEQQKNRTEPARSGPEPAESLGPAEAVALALSLKDRGNVAFRAAAPGDEAELGVALKFYEQALAVDFHDLTLEAVLCSNKAAVFLRLGDSGRAIRACYRAIEADPANVKAQLRGALASRELGFLAQAARFCDRGLKLAPQNTELCKLQADLILELAAKRGDPPV